VLFHNAGDCFEAAASLGIKSEDCGKAGDAYASAEEFDAAVRMYRRCDMLDEAVRIVQENRAKMTPSVAENILELAKLFYFRKRDYKCVSCAGCLIVKLTLD